MEAAALIGRGRSAEIFEYGEDKVLKLFSVGFPVEMIESEFRIGTILNDLALRVPRAYGTIEMDGRTGIVYERIRGRSMIDGLSDNPLKLISCGLSMARLHREIHRTTANLLPAQNDRFRNAIESSAPALGKRADVLLRRLDAMRAGNAVCHGDFHPGNILISGKKSVAIDWMNAYAGTPAGDVARTWLMLNSPFMPQEISPLLKRISVAAKRILCGVYLREYLKLSELEKDDVRHWIPLVAAVRLGERLPGEEKWLLKLISGRSSQDWE